MRKLLSVIALTAVIGTAWASDLPNVRILAVGGTIAGTAAAIRSAVKMSLFMCRCRF